ncbi:MAG: 6-bladed beta-propeller [Bacteroidales bacterium]|nr:6-bladed beta-propeller [Bacteroidales bacterium]
MYLRSTKIAFLLFIVLLSCNTEKQDSEESKNRGLKEIELYSARKNLKETKLSDYAKSIKYIKIDSSLLIQSVWSLRTDGEYLGLINFSNDLKSRSAVLLDKDGGLVRKIGAQGNGPGEFFSPRDIALFPESRTIILDDNHGALLKYDYDGNFLDRTKIHYFSSPVIPLSDSTFALFKTSDYGEGGTDMIKIFNLKLEVKKTMIDRSKYSGIYTQLGTASSFNVDNTGIHFWIGYSDTSYFLTDKMGLIPENHYNIGPSQLTNELQYSNPKSRFKEYEYIASTITIRENSFITYFDHGERYYMIHNSKLDKTSSIKSSLSFPYAGLENDIDGGVSFFPAEQLTGKTYYRSLDPLKLLKHKDELIENAKSQGIETDNEFFSLLESINENDNPILMLVEMK